MCRMRFWLYAMPFGILDNLDSKINGQVPGGEIIHFYGTLLGDR